MYATSGKRRLDGVYLSGMDLVVSAGTHFIASLETIGRRLRLGQVVVEEE